MPEQVSIGGAVPSVREGAQQLAKHRLAARCRGQGKVPVMHDALTAPEVMKLAPSCSGQSWLGSRYKATRVLVRPRYLQSRLRLRMEWKDSTAHAAASRVVGPHKQKQHARSGDKAATIRSDGEHSYCR